MRRFFHNRKFHEVDLLDDGTLDTVIRVDGKVARFSQEHAAEFRQSDGALPTKGLLILAREALDSDMFEEED